MVKYYLDMVETLVRFQYRLPNSQKHKYLYPQENSNDTNGWLH